MTTDATWVGGAIQNRSKLPNGVGLEIDSSFIELPVTLIFSTANEQRGIGFGQPEWIVPPRPFDTLNNVGKNYIVSKPRVSSQPSSQPVHDNKEKKATYINTCWSCRYDVREGQRTCSICKGGRKPPIPKPLLRAANQNPPSYGMPYMKTATLLSISTDVNAIRKHIDEYKWTLSGSRREEKNFVGRRPEIKLLNETDTRPGVMFTAAQDSNPSMDLDTWSELGCPLLEAVDVDVCIPYPPSRKRRHKQRCGCYKCIRAGWMNAIAKFVLSSSKPGDSIVSY
jgi:hypothetical protein